MYPDGVTSAEPRCQTLTPECAGVGLENKVTAEDFRQNMIRRIVYKINEFWWMLPQANRTVRAIQIKEREFEYVSAQNLTSDAIFRLIELHKINHTPLTIKQISK